MSKVDMNYIDYLYTKSGILGQNTRKSPAGDLFREVATALDVNTTLLKEGHDPNRRYCFEEEHAPLILEMLEVAKSWEGKRLRCRDYSGCGVETIKYFISVFYTLYKDNGASEDDQANAFLRMFAQTNFITEIAAVDPALLDAVGDFLFAPNDRYPNKSDWLGPADQYVFIGFLRENPSLDPHDILRIYSMYCIACEHRDQETVIPPFMDALHSMMPDEREEYQASIFKHRELEKAVENDAEVIADIRAIKKIASGKSKLGNRKKMEAIIEHLIERIDHHAELLNLPLSDERRAIFKSVHDASLISLELVRGSQELLDKTIARHKALKDFRQENTIEDTYCTIDEMQFEERFGFSMF